MNKFLVSFSVLLLFIIGFILGMSSPNITGFFVADIGGNRIDESLGENEIPTFRIYTKALCRNVSDFIVCRDEVYAQCGEFEYILPDTKVNGEGIFNKDWEDPRLSK